MTLLVYSEKASGTHEHQMLPLFLERLEDRWANSTDWIVAVANAMWNGAEIDSVCILPSAIIVADFKSYGGTLKQSRRKSIPWLLYWCTRSARKRKGTDGTPSQSVQND